MVVASGGPPGSARRASFAVENVKNVKPDSGVLCCKGGLG
jgi:hypothetical protein